tara:strand:+ start:595 stop:1179 length:585 start_codon:yes stop_codon:yes gene_type:complete
MDIYLEKKKKCIYAEIGIDKGITVLRRCEKLNTGSEIHLFDLNHKVKNVSDEVKSKYGDKFIVREFGVIKGDYNWDLMKIINEKESLKYDYVYLDGAHTLTIDGLAFVLIDKLLNVGGFIEFDDYNWTIGKSPTCSPYPPVNNKKWLKNYTKEQIDTSHVKLIVDNLVKTNKRYKEIVPNRIYQKIIEDFFDSV